MEGASTTAVVQVRKAVQLFIDQRVGPPAADREAHFLHSLLDLKGPIQRICYYFCGIYLDGCQTRKWSSACFPSLVLLAMKPVYTYLILAEPAAQAVLRATSPAA
jgi:hypothetical protein